MTAYTIYSVIGTVAAAAGVAVTLALQSAELRAKWKNRGGPAKSARLRHTYDGNRLTIHNDGDGDAWSIDIMFDKTSITSHGGVNQLPKDSINIVNGRHVLSADSSFHYDCYFNMMAPPPRAVIITWKDASGGGRVSNSL